MIQIDHLTKSYPGFRLDISLSLPRGRVTGVVGRNGAGKSTTIKAILGLVRPDSGSVKVFGKDAAALTAADRQRMGTALAESGFSSMLHVQAIAKILQNMYPAFDAGQFLQRAREQGLPPQKLIKEYSTGMKAKLRVLTALSYGADLLILDEPTAGLDVVARGELLDMIRDYMAADESRSLLITSHISSDLEGLCDDIYMIHDGVVSLHEDTDVLLGRYGVMKLTDAMYQKLDRQYILQAEKTAFGWLCLTDQRQFYAENYPQIVMENGSIDDLILMLTTQSGRAAQ